MKEITNITFSVKGPSDAQIGLLADIKSNLAREPFYETHIGGYSNKRCALRKEGYNGTVYRYSPAMAECMLNALTFRPYWISWKKNVIKLGQGAIVGSGEIHSFPDDAPMKINHLAFSSRATVSNQFKYYNGKKFLFLSSKQNVTDK